MTNWRGFNLSMHDRLRSVWNEALFRLRNRVKFRRGSYVERSDGEASPEFGPAETSRITRYKSLNIPTGRLSLPSQLRTWATLDLLHAIPEALWAEWQGRLPDNRPKLLDAGCQDFSRAPALQAFFRSRGLQPHLTGVELDAYTLLGTLHSRADRAEFFSRLAGDSSFLATDFFSLSNTHKFDAILCFYPFVSPHPALAWGLPYEFGDAAKWTEAIARHLRPGGVAFLVHQGAWEEAEFREANSQLKCLFSAEFQETFEPHEHPSRIALYCSER